MGSRRLKTIPTGVDVDEAVPSLVQLNPLALAVKPKIVMSEARLPLQAEVRRHVRRGDGDRPPLVQGGMVGPQKPDRFERRYIAQVAAYKHSTHLYMDGKKMAMPKGWGLRYSCAATTDAGYAPWGDTLLKEYWNKMFKPALACWKAQSLALPPKGKEVWL